MTKFLVDDCVFPLSGSCPHDLKKTAVVALNERLPHLKSVKLEPQRISRTSLSHTGISPGESFDEFTAPLMELFKRAAFAEQESVWGRRGCANAEGGSAYLYASDRGGAKCRSLDTHVRLGRYYAENIGIDVDHEMRASTGIRQLLVLNF